MLPRCFPIAAALLCVAAAATDPLAAQSVVTVSPSQCVWHDGDNPAWAATSLDETAWQPYSSWTANTARPHLWVRCHVELDSLRSIAQPAIQVTLYSAYQVYFNGALIGAEGNLANGNTSLNAIRSYAVSSRLFSSDHSSLALRITNRITVSNSGPIRGLIDSPLQLRAGDALLLDALRARTVLARTALFARTAIGFAIIGVLAIVLLGFFLYDRGRSELLLLSVACLCLAALRINEFATASLLNYSVSACLMIIGLSNVGLTVTQVPFFYAIARRQMPKSIFVLMSLIALAYIPTAVDAFSAANQPAWMGPLNTTFIRPFALIAHIAISFVPFFVFWPYLLIPRRVRPLAVLCMLWAAADIIWFAVEVTGFSVPGIPDLFARWGADAAGGARLYHLLRPRCPARPPLPRTAPDH